MSDLRTRPKSPTAQDEARQRARLDRLYMPAMPPLWLFERIKRVLRRRRVRRGLRGLLECDDHILDDLGYSRAALRRLLDKPQSSAERACDRKARGEP